MIGKNVEESGRGLIWGTVAALAWYTLWQILV